MQRSAKRSSIPDIFWIAVTCLTTRWIFIPVGIALYTSLGMFLFVYIHPLAIFVAPAIMAVYALWLEDKRLKAIYEPYEHQADSNMQHLWTTHHMELKKLMDEYIELLEKRDENKE